MGCSPTNSATATTSTNVARTIRRTEGRYPRPRAGNLPFAQVAASTERIQVGVGVTCPIVRVHPAVVAQAVATTSLLFDGRFFLGVGTGEALNEHIVGRRWPPPAVRLEMLEEAVGIMRALFTG